MFINSINHFRAIAIIFIVAGHSYGLAGVYFNSVSKNIAQNLIAGVTVLFVFISGFLFHYVFYKKYIFKKFITGKIKHVLLPYLVLGIFPIFYRIEFDIHFWHDFFIPNGEGVFNEYIMPVLKYYWTGRFLIAYWYIPFIMVTFLMSPLHVVFIKLNVKIQIIIITLFLITSSLLHRPIENLYVFQSVLYFFPVYLMGIVCSIYKEKIYSTLKQKEIFLLIAVIALAIIQEYIGVVGNYHKDPFAYKGIDLMIFQKIILCLFFMVWLHRFEKINNKYIHTLAATSFTIFFIHPLLFFILDITKWGMGIPADIAWVLFPFVVSIVILICIGIGLGVKKLMPKYSRYIIGY